MDWICRHCGCENEGAAASKPRSLPQHRRLFGVIREAFKQWPHAHEFTPETAEHLRAYLICAAGEEFRECHRVDLPDDPDITPRVARLFATACEAVMSQVRERHRYSFIRTQEGGTGVAVYVPLSISFEAMPHKTFDQLSSKVDEVLRVAGLNPDQLYAEEGMSA